MRAEIIESEEFGTCRRHQDVAIQTFHKDMFDLFEKVGRSVGIHLTFLLDNR